MVEVRRKIALSTEIVIVWKSRKIWQANKSRLRRVSQASAVMRADLSIWLHSERSDGRAIDDHFTLCGSSEMVSHSSCTCPRKTLSIIDLVVTQHGTTYLAASPSCHAAFFVGCSVLGHEFEPLLLRFLLGLLLGIFAFEELSVIRRHHLLIAALLCQLSLVLVQVSMVVIHSVDCVTDLDNDAEDHEDASDSKAGNDTDQIGSLELREITSTSFLDAEFVSISLSGQ